MQRRPAKRRRKPVDKVSEIDRRSAGAPRLAQSPHAAKPTDASKRFADRVGRPSRIVELPLHHPERMFHLGAYRVLQLALGHRLDAAALGRDKPPAAPLGGAFLGTLVARVGVYRFSLRCRRRGINQSIPKGAHTLASHSRRSEIVWKTEVRLASS